MAKVAEECVPPMPSRLISGRYPAGSVANTVPGEPVALTSRFKTTNPPKTFFSDVWLMAQLVPGTIEPAPLVTPIAAYTLSNPTFVAALRVFKSFERTLVCGFSVVGGVK